MNLRRHRCNGCRNLFDCWSCKHTAMTSVVFCSEKCREAFQKEDLNPLQGHSLRANGGAKREYNYARKGRS